MNLEELKQILINSLEGLDADKIQLMYDHPETYKQYYGYIFDFYSNYPDNAGSLNELGYMYEHGLGMERNIEKAIELYKKAIQKDHRDAMYNLASMYDYGEGVEHNYKKAIKLYKKGIELGDSDAIN